MTSVNLQADLEREEESKKHLLERLNELESVKLEVESNMSSMKTQQQEHEKKLNHSLRVQSDLEEHLKMEREKVGNILKMGRLVYRVNNTALKTLLKTLNEKKNQQIFILRKKGLLNDPPNWCHVKWFTFYFN